MLPVTGAGCRSNGTRSASTSPTVRLKNCAASRRVIQGDNLDLSITPQKKQLGKSRAAVQAFFTLTFLRLRFAAEARTWRPVPTREGVGRGVPTEPFRVFRAI